MRRSATVRCSATVRRSATVRCSAARVPVLHAPMGDDGSEVMSLTASPLRASVGKAGAGGAAASTSSCSSTCAATAAAAGQAHRMRSQPVPYTRAMSGGCAASLCPNHRRCLAAAWG